MPIYEYVCQKCGNSFERMESINNEEIIKKCEKCGGEAHRIISNSSFQLKGGGWYSSSYSKDKPAPCPAAKGETPACGSCCAAASND